MTFDTQLVLERLEDELDGLAQRLEEALAVAASTPMIRVTVPATLRRHSL